MEEVRNLTGIIRSKPEGESRTVTFVASTYARDRHGTVVNQEGWRLENFNKNGIIGYQHNVYGDMCEGPNPDDVIGKGFARLEGDELLIDITFEPKEINPQAEKIFQKVMFGSLNAVSVGFGEVGKGKFGEGDEARGGTNQTYYFEGQELYEVSVVNIPSNYEALKKQVRTSTAHAVTYLKGLWPEVSYSEIEKMTVGQVIRKLENREDNSPEAAEENKPSKRQILQLKQTQIELTGK